MIPKLKNRERAAMSILEHQSTSGQRKHRNPANFNSSNLSKERKARCAHELEVERMKNLIRFVLDARMREHGRLCPSVYAEILLKAERIKKSHKKELMEVVDRRYLNFQRGQTDSDNPRWQVSYVNVDAYTKEFEEILQEIDNIRFERTSATEFANALESL